MRIYRRKTQFIGPDDELSASAPQLPGNQLLGQQKSPLSNANDGPDYLAVGLIQLDNEQNKAFSFKKDQTYRLICFWGK